MGFVATVQERMNEVFAVFWSPGEKAALLRVLQEVYKADGVFSEDEQRQYEGFSGKLMSSSTMAYDLNLDQAFGLLRGDERKMSLVYSWMAEAVASERQGQLETADFDQAERDLIEQLVLAYDLDRDRLAAELKKTRQERLDEVMNAWAKEMG